MILLWTGTSPQGWLRGRDKGRVFGRSREAGVGGVKERKADRS